MAITVEWNGREGARFTERPGGDALKIEYIRMEDGEPSKTKGAKGEVATEPNLRSHSATFPNSCSVARCSLVLYAVRRRCTEPPSVGHCCIMRPSDVAATCRVQACSCITAAPGGTGLLRETAGLSSR
uniref:Uncharacterized protein n=1 Tax=Oryza barthii TaxID=65489 RepID=A0A0D3ETW9_9ORYZ